MCKIQARIMLKGGSVVLNAAPVPIPIERKLMASRTQATLLRHLLSALMLPLAAGVCTQVLAQDKAPEVKAPEPEYTLAFNAGLVSDYRFRGIAQTSGKPAIQGGI